MQVSENQKQLTSEDRCHVETYPSGVAYNFQLPGWVRADLSRCLFLSFIFYYLCMLWCAFFIIYLGAHFICVLCWCRVFWFIYFYFFCTWCVWLFYLFYLWVVWCAHIFPLISLFCGFLLRKAYMANLDYITLEWHYTSIQLTDITQHWSYNYINKQILTNQTVENSFQLWN